MIKKYVLKSILLIMFFLSIKIHSSIDPIDVVICCHKKDLRTLDLAIEGIKKFGKNIRRIIVVSEQKLTNNAEWFDESLFPFSKYDVSLAIFNNDSTRALEFSKSGRIGWIYKQLLNWYSPFVIPEISSNILILDADTIFLKEVEFIDNDDYILYCTGTEYHLPYFEHARKLISGENQITRMHLDFSGIAHHFLFKKEIVEDLFKNIYDTHKIEPWRAMCKCLDHNHIYDSSMAEGEIYLNFALKSKKKIKIRQLKWKDMKFDPEEIKAKKLEGYDFVSCHYYLG